MEYRKYADEFRARAVCLAGDDLVLGKAASQALRLILKRRFTYSRACQSAADFAKASLPDVKRLVRKILPGGYFKSAEAERARRYANERKAKSQRRKDQVETNVQKSNTME